jgi:hypothetical protein
VDCANYGINITVSATVTGTLPGSIQVSVSDTLAKGAIPFRADYTNSATLATHFPTGQLTYSETIHWSAPNGQSGNYGPVNVSWSAYCLR